MTLQLDRAADGIWTLELDRPDKLNALTDDMVRELDAMLVDIGRQQDCRVLLLTGAGRGFCAGFDLGLAQDAPSSEQGEAAAWTIRQEAFAGLVMRLRSLRQPVIAAVNGVASGAGFGLALACDLRVAASTARFNAAFIKVGMSGCDIGVSWLLPRCIGTAHAFELMLTGRMVDADEAARIGLVSRVTSAAELMTCAHELASVVANHDMFAVWMTKRGMWANLEAPSLQAALELENRTQILTRTTGALAQAARNLTERTRK